MNSPFPALRSALVPRRRWWRALGWGLCAAALAAAGWGGWVWFRVIDSERDELAEYAVGGGANRLARWHGIRARLRRGYLSHDDMIRVGRLGDSEAVELLMERMPATGRVRGCLGSRLPHAAEALERLTAHSAGSTAEEWHAWWREHRGKSQATLIRESFKPLGIDPQKPPNKEQTLGLLHLIGLPSVLGTPNESAPVPSKARTFNALRILRDHEVKPEVVMREDILGANGEAILKGLTAYVEFRAENPVSNGAGVLFGDHSGAYYDDYFEEQSWLLRSAWAPWAWWGVVVLLGAGGVGGAWRLWWSKAHKVPVPL